MIKCINDMSYDESSLLRVSSIVDGLSSTLFVDDLDKIVASADPEQIQGMITKIDQDIEQIFQQNRFKQNFDKAKTLVNMLGVGPRSILKEMAQDPSNGLSCEARYLGPQIHETFYAM